MFIGREKVGRKRPNEKEAGRCAVRKAEEKNKDACKRLGAAEHALRPWTLQFFSRMHAQLGLSSMDTLDGDRILKCNAVRHL